MPVYEYMCGSCGPFTMLRSMAEYEMPSHCPECGKKAPRVMLTAPVCLSMSAQSQLAHAANERSASKLKTSSSPKGSHDSGCACCSTLNSRMSARGKGGTKSFQPPSQG